MSVQEQVEGAIDTMLDCFGGSDGGMSFIQMKILAQEMSRQVDEEGNDAALEVCQVILRMEKFIKVAGKR